MEETMDIMQAMQERHAVRSYTEEPISQEAKDALQAKIDEVNRVGNLHVQMVCDEPKAFDGFMAHYGKFSGVTNYIAMIGPKGGDLSERVGYYGEELVLLAQQLGLNTCWVAMTFSKVKTAYELRDGEKLVVVISLGHGATQGVAHKSKEASAVSTVEGEAPAWFDKGIQAALLAPTASNQQVFHFTLKDDGIVEAKAGTGFYSHVDLGIAKLHFELGAGTENFAWA